MILSSELDVPFRQLELWYHSPLGRKIAQHEIEGIQQILLDIFGYYLVQLGGTEVFFQALSTTRVRRRLFIPGDFGLAQVRPSVLAELTQLPFASESIDAILLPHTLDFAASPQKILHEVERVLIPDGHIIIIGFNAISLWNLWSFWHLFLNYKDKNTVPWNGQFWSTAQITDWLIKLGFMLELKKYTGFELPFEAKFFKPGYQIIAMLISRLCYPLGGIYILHAVKKVTPLTPIKSTWFKKHSILRAAIRPTTRETGNV